MQDQNEVRLFGASVPICVVAVLRQLGILTGFGVLAIAWSYPLATSVSTHMPGGGIADNSMFFWNFWWMRQALESGTSFFTTPFLFAPVGVDLTLHTHSALPALVGATLFGSLSVLSALNLTTLIGLALNGYLACLLAWRTTADRFAALSAGIVFGASPYIAAHLNGHFNLVHAWIIPLFVLTFTRTLAGSLGWGIATGTVVAAMFFIDYYYVVFTSVLMICFFSSTRWNVCLTRQPATGHSRRVFRLVAVFIVLDLLAVALASLTSGFSARWGPVRLSMRDTFNARQILWLLICAAAWVRFRPRIRVVPSGAPSRRLLVAVLAMSAVVSVLAQPILWNSVKLVLKGQYVTQQYYWRSSPKGIDLATLVLGNPFHGILGALTRHAYMGLGIDVIECGAWLGIVPVVLSAYALRRHRQDAILRIWFMIAIVFTVWAIGTHTQIAGANTGMIMPGAFLRWVPIVSNARIPGRAMVIVYLALALMTAIGLSTYRRASGRPAAAGAVIIALLLIELTPAPFPVVRVQCASIYGLLRTRPERGSVVELPLGLGDGLGALTLTDHRMLMCQSVHGRPLVGGIVARLPPSVLAFYRSDPLLASLMRLSEPRPGAIDDGPIADARIARERLGTDGIDFIILNTATASSQLRQYVERSLPVVELATERDQVLYLVQH